MNKNKLITTCCASLMLLINSSALFAYDIQIALTAHSEGNKASIEFTSTQITEQEKSAGLGSITVQGEKTVVDNLVFFLKDAKFERITQRLEWLVNEQNAWPEEMKTPSLPVLYLFVALSAIYDSQHNNKSVQGNYIAKSDAQYPILKRAIHNLLEHSEDPLNPRSFFIKSINQNTNNNIVEYLKNNDLVDNSDVIKFTEQLAKCDWNVVLRMSDEEFDSICPKQEREKTDQKIRELEAITKELVEQQATLKQTLTGLSMWMNTGVKELVNTFNDKTNSLNELMKQAGEVASKSKVSAQVISDLVANLPVTLASLLKGNGQ